MMRYYELANRLRLACLEEDAAGIVIILDEAADAIEALAQECESSVARATDAEEALRKRRPVVRGKWKKRMEEKETLYYKSFTPIWSFSECGREYDPSLCMTINFCPNCGADMREAAPTIIPAEPGGEETT